MMLLCTTQLAQASRSQVVDGYLMIPRVDVEGYDGFELVMRIEYQGEFLFILQSAFDADSAVERSGVYDQVSQTLLVDEIEVENGELYSATLELASVSPDIVFRLQHAELLGTGMPQDPPTDTEPEPDPDPVDEPGTGLTDIQGLMSLPELNCANSACHDATPGSARVNLLTGTVEDFIARLVDQPSGSPSCGDELLIDASDPANSLLLKLLDSDSGTQCIAKMPLGQSGVAPEHFAEFVAWVNELAAASTAQQSETPSNADPILSTSFDYGQECSQRGNLGNADCGSIADDGIYWNWGATMLGGHSTEAVAEANYPDGAGGLGFRSWVGDGVNSQTGEARIDFPGGPQKELWIRWYQRYEQGFSWAGGSPQYDKTLYINSNGNSSVLPQHASNGGWALTMQGAPDYYQAVSQPNITWNDIFGSSSDGQFHLFEIYIKMDTDSSDGIGRMWIDGNLVIDANGLDYSGGNSSSRQGWTWMEFHSNQRTPENGRPYYVDYDDMAIYAETPPNTDSNGYPWIGPVNDSVGGGGGGESPPPSPAGSEASMDYELLFEDPIEDNNFASRGWYDNTALVLSDSVADTDSTKSIEYRFNTGATQPTSGGAIRRKFTATDSVYISYDVKYSDNWVGSQKSYHPHEFYILTNKDSDWSGLAYTNLTTYIEQVDLRPNITIQDGKNIDTGSLNQNLVNTTENRSVAGCNGDSNSGMGNAVTCYSAGGGDYWNGKAFEADSATISRNTWQRVEAFVKLNSIQNGAGVADGVIRYWLDGQLVLEHENIIFRTAQHSDMLFDQIVIAPWIGDGSPVTQTLWVDNLIVGK